MGSVTSRVKASDGVELHVEVNEPDASGSGGGLGSRTIVFSCAFTTTRENWRAQVSPLCAAGHQVVLWDFRGHGLSDAPEDAAAYSMDHVIDDLGRVLDHAAPEGQVVLAGLSFGGLTSLHYTHRHPARVAALVLADTGPGFKKPEAAAAWKARSEKTADYLERRGMEHFVNGKAASTCIGRNPELPAARTAAAAILEQSPHGLAQFGRHVAGLAPSVIDELPGILQPALVVVGEDDEAYLQAAQVMNAKLPNSRYEVIAGAGHIVNIEATDLFNALVLDFLGGLPV
jgi:pimeloyl-ACP methyl ester carboxylesterase